MSEQSHHSYLTTSNEAGPSHSNSNSNSFSSPTATSSSRVHQPATSPNSNSNSSAPLTSTGTGPGPGPNEAVVSSSIEAKPAPAPTVYVTYGTRSVKARIDKEVPLDEIISQLVNSQQLAVAEPAALFALREKDTGRLVTEDNLLHFLDKGTASFVLCSSPVIEAVEIVDKLRSSEPGALKLATFSLRTLIKEPAFLDAFLAREGLEALQNVVGRATGNTLAYALLSLQNLLELEEKSSQSLDKTFVARIVQIIATEPLINIVRPATAILRRLSLQTRSNSTRRESNSEPQVHRTSATSASLNSSTGFVAIYNAIQEQVDFMQIAVGRLSSGDLALALLSLGLINSLFKGATELGDERLVNELDRLGTNAIVGDLLETWKDNGDISPILDYQSNVIASLHSQLNTPVDEAHYGLFDDVWSASGIDESKVEESSRWQTLGFKSESPQIEFESTGILGLKTLVAYAKDPANNFATSIREALARPAPRRLPLATVSSAVVLALAEHFHITEGISSTPTLPNPYLLQFERCHSLATQFFIRIWLESGATETDFDRVVTLMRSQIANVLTIGAAESKSWATVKDEFLKVEYRTVRDRQMRELEIEDDILSKAPVRHLRGRLYLESFEFVRNQRIACLHEGAWFRVPTATIPSGHSEPRSGSLRRHVKDLITPAPIPRWRFYRLAANRRVLHFVETNERVETAPGLVDLRERIDVAYITDVVPTGVSSSTLHRTRVQSQPSAPSITSSNPTSLSTGRQTPTNSSTTATTTSTTLPHSSQALSFALHSSEGVLAELIAPDESTYSEWIDGLSLLRPEGSIISSSTADYVHTLTEIGVKIKLLDLSGEKVDIPHRIDIKDVPAFQQDDPRSAFFYSENL